MAKKLNELLGENKMAARDKVFDVLKDFPDVLNILTLPGPHWVFENNLLQHREGLRVMLQGEPAMQTHIYAVESNPTTFRKARGSRVIPGAVYEVDPLHYVKTSAGVDYHRMQVEDFLSSFPDTSLNAAWLDFCGPPTRERLEATQKIFDRVTDMLIVTISGNIRKPGGNDALRSRGGVIGWAEEISKVENWWTYNDGTPMHQFFFRKNSSGAMSRMSVAYEEAVEFEDVEENDHESSDHVHIKTPPASVSVTSVPVVLVKTVSSADKVGADRMLRYLRCVVGLSSETIAKEVGMSKKAISNWYTRPATISPGVNRVGEFFETRFQSLTAQKILLGGIKTQSPVTLSRTSADYLLHNACSSPSLKIGMKQAWDYIESLPKSTTTEPKLEPTTTASIVSEEPVSSSQMLRYLRCVVGLSAADTAKALSTKPSYVSMWYTGKPPSVFNLGILELFKHHYPKRVARKLPGVYPNKPVGPCVQMSEDLARSLLHVECSQPGVTNTLRDVWRRLEKVPPGAYDCYINNAEAAALLGIKEGSLRATLARHRKETWSGGDTAPSTGSPALWNKDHVSQWYREVRRAK